MHAIIGIYLFKKNASLTIPIYYTRKYTNCKPQRLNNVFTNTTNFCYLHKRSVDMTVLFTY